MEQFDRIVKKYMKTETFDTTATLETPPELAEIAKRCLGVATLDTQNSDSKDFHDLAVWSIKAALVAAFDAGTKAVTSQSALESSSP